MEKPPDLQRSLLDLWKDFKADMEEKRVREEEQMALEKAERERVARELIDSRFQDGLRFYQNGCYQQALDCFAPNFDFTDSATSVDNHLPSVYFSALAAKQLGDMDKFARLILDAASKGYKDALLIAFANK